MRIKRNVVMLPTNEKANIEADNWYLPNSKTLIINNFKSNLYILSDEEIKKGDWCIMLDDFGNVFSNPQQYTDPNTQHLNKGLRKIIATTDKSLIIEGKAPSGDIAWRYTFPQPLQSFIEYFVSEYNKGNIITEVMVEYQEGKYNLDELRERHLKGLSHSYDYYNLIINSDNTINIKPIKDNWNREEVIILLKVFERDLIHNRVILDEWIEENI